MEKLSHILYKIVIKTQLPDFLFKLSYFILSIHSHIESFFKCIILDDKLSYIFFFLHNFSLKRVDILIFAFEFIFKVLFKSDFVCSHKNSKFIFFFFDSSIRLQLKSLNKTFFKSKLLSNRLIQ